MPSAAVKFTQNDFRVIDTPNLIINVWTYSENLKKNKLCGICQTYLDFCLNILEERWRKEWGDYNFVMAKLRNNDKSFIDVSSFSSADRYLIMSYLKKLK